MKFHPPLATGVVTCLLNSEDVASRATFEVASLELDFDGIPGNRHYGQTKPAGGREKHYPTGTPMANNRQWSAVSEEELDASATIMGLPDLEPGWIGANIVLEGIPNFSQLPLVTHLFFEHNGQPGPVLVVFEHNGPCTWPDPYIEEGAGRKPEVSFAKGGLNRRGLVGWVDKPGVIHTGDTVAVRTVKLSEIPE